MTTLSDEGIIRDRDLGIVVIEPFVLNNVNTASYDVRLGPHFYREQPREEPHPDAMDYNEVTFCNIYSPEANREIWGESLYADDAKVWMKLKPELDWRNISPNDQIILIRPKENLLCHTIEFIGGRVNTTTAMKARSSIGRSLMNVCQCAGQGDVGYFNRWTMEVYNRSRYRTIALPVNRRIAQIVFDKTTFTGRSYGAAGEGSYQDDETYTNLDYAGTYRGGREAADAEVKHLIRTWHPSMMLAQLFKDRDIPDDCRTR